MQSGSVESPPHASRKHGTTPLAEPIFVYNPEPFDPGKRFRPACGAGGVGTAPSRHYRAASAPAPGARTLKFWGDSPEGCTTPPESSHSRTRRRLAGRPGRALVRMADLNPPVGSIAK